MRLHIELDDDLVAQLDKVAGHRGRSAFVRRAIVAAMRHQQSWAAIESAAGAIEDSGHDWDADPAAWVRAQRHSDRRRTG